MGSVNDLQELTFHFNEKTLKEVKKIIAILLNENVNEFEYVGAINNSEYIILFPHQSLIALEIKLKEIAESISANFFANLGEFSIQIKYRCDEPAPQDIDPYIFLSTLSDKVNSESI